MHAQSILFGILDFAHLAAKQECKLLNAVGTKCSIVFYFIMIHLLRQLNCGTDVLNDGPSVPLPLSLLLSLSLSVAIFQVPRFHTDGI